jgi:hypothetical protein
MMPRVKDHNPFGTKTIVSHWGPSGKPKLSKPNTVFNSIAVIWLKYCLNGVNPKSINQSIISPVGITNLIIGQTRSSGYTRGGTRCLRGVNIPCRPKQTEVTSTVGIYIVKEPLLLKAIIVTHRSKCVALYRQMVT